MPAYHATGTGKTVTAVMDAKTCGGRTLFLAHTHELVDVFNWQEEAADMVSQMLFTG